MSNGPSDPVTPGADISNLVTPGADISGPSAVQNGESKPKVIEVKVNEVVPVRPWQHVVVWLVGVVFAALVPLLLPYFHGLDMDDTPSMTSLLGHGDLLLIALVITIAGITELSACGT